ncbi:MAG: adenylosuccinate synthase [Phycisphaeraceae bacterium]|nr:MAG: adenylosuccinate synthase [Phycisphaeraceae bacterium]
MNRTDQCTAVIGLQWGDEGKGKLVDLLAAEHDLVVRYNGGANAGHSVVVGGERFALHLVPSGILSPATRTVIGNGVVVDPARLLDEIEKLEARGVKTEGRIAISDRAHVVLDYHKSEDGLREELLKAGQAGKRVGAGTSQEIGTTRRGIGPCYADKVTRATGVRMGDLLRPDALRRKVELACRMKHALFEGLASSAHVEWEPFEPDAIIETALGHGDKLRHRITDTTYLLHDELNAGRRLLFEGANATLLDVDHGTYPYVTSSNSSVLGAGPGSGVPGHRLDRVIGVMKAYSTRVGGGPMPTELHDETGNQIRERGHEYGTTTGRPRRVGWLDLVALRYACMVNGVSEVAIMLLDVLAGFDDLKVCTAYIVDGRETDRFPPDAADLEHARPVYETLSGFGEEITGVTSMGELPAGAAAYVDRIERHLGVPVRVVSVGPDRAQTIRLSETGCAS